MAKINSKMKQLEKLQKQIEEEKSKINEKMGEQVIKKLNFDYDNLDNKTINVITDNLAFDNDVLYKLNDESELSNEEKTTNKIVDDLNE
ncbi:hypothetical protein BHX94_12290 (plasmid) [Macrococcoides bohemicum]|uniref:Uncharacterized protein n=1 Tax=Macrococcoides bohemicum TaxID=1903056 RepID=A0A328A215_9STAP|nr:hypothetical protein [Macrococcus bohemicus]RAK47854.1 hypothetical protein BHX94_12290 [Macrococcus bohemicus]